MNRREFISASITAAVVTGLSRSGVSAGTPKIERLGIECWAIRDELKKNVQKTFAMIASIGYREVELVWHIGDLGLTPKQWRKGASSVVCEADIAVDRFLRERLRAQTPAYGWLSEETEDDPARLDANTVWIVDPSALTVSLRKLELLSSDPATALVGKGLALGDIVVTAGANLLQEGQRVQPRRPLMPTRSPTARAAPSGAHSMTPAAS